MEIYTEKYSCCTGLSFSANKPRLTSAFSVAICFVWTAFALYGLIVPLGLIRNFDKFTKAAVGPYNNEDPKDPRAYNYSLEHSKDNHMITQS